MWQGCKALWTSWPDSVYPWRCCQIAVAGWHLMWLLIFLVIYLVGNVTKETLVCCHFFLLPSVFFSLSLFNPYVYLSPSLPHHPYLFLLSYHIIMCKIIYLSLSGEIGWHLCLDFVVICSPWSTSTYRSLLCTWDMSKYQELRSHTGVLRL